MRRLSLGLLILALSAARCAFGQINPPFNQCPPVGRDSGCAILLEIDANGSLRVNTDPSQGPYDGEEDTLIGVQNNSTKKVLAIPLKGPLPFFSFDGDGICGKDSNTGQPFRPAPPGCPFGPTGYEGPGVSFSNISADLTSGTVNFAGGIPPGGKAYFSLERAIQTLCPALTGVPLLKQSAPPWAPDTYGHLYDTRNFPDATSTAVSASGTLELVVFPIGSAQPTSPGATSFPITLTPTTNNLNGLRDAINALAAGVTASVVSASGGASRLSIAPNSSVNSIQLRKNPGDPTSNILTTIGAKGCWLTSAAMIVNYHAARQGAPFSTTPRELNNFLNDRPTGYLGRALVNPSEVATFARLHGVRLSNDGPVDGRNDFVLDSYLCSGNPVILEVGNPHFVVATGQTTVSGKNTYNINDPGFPKDSLAGYNFTYSGLRLFSPSTGNTPLSALYVVAHSPVELLVSGPTGRRTGVDPVAGAVFRDIPASGYVTDSIADDEDPTTSDPTPEVKSFEVMTPASGTYLVQAIGTAAGPYTLDFIGYDVFGNASMKTLRGTASPGATTSYQVTYSSALGAQIQVAQAADTVPPVTTASASPGANANGWNNSDVTVNLISTDNEPGGTGVKEIHISLSGAQSATTIVPGGSASVLISAEGTTTLTYFAVDNVGNREAAKMIVVMIDKTPPAITGLPAPGCSLWPPNHELVQVATVSAADNLSGLATFNVSASSSEPDDGHGPVIVIGGVDLQPRVVQLQAERLGDGPGRVYTISAIASDVARNTTIATAICTVPHDQGH